MAAVSKSPVTDPVTVDDVTVWLNPDDEDGNGDKVRCLEGRYASIRCRRLIFTDKVGFSLIFNDW